MRSAKRQHRTKLPLIIVLSIAAATCATNGPEQDARVSGQDYPSLRMVDGKEWLTKNLNVATAESFCFDDQQANCQRYGRLYRWTAAQQACALLGSGWRLPTDDDWLELADHYGGAFDGAEGSGKGAYQALLTGGRSGFNATLSGGRSFDDGKYDDLEAHGFYWTASEIDSAIALFYNFARGGLTLYRQPDGEKPLALSVRCVR